MKFQIQTHLRDKCLITLNDGSKIELNVDDCMHPQTSQFDKELTSSKYCGRYIIDLKDIFIPKDRNNICRDGKTIDPVQVDKIADLIERKGIDYAQRPPVVIKERKWANGRWYEYVLSDTISNHRADALMKIGANSWIWDIYTPMNKWESIDTGFLTNLVPPVKESTSGSAKNSLLSMIEENRWGEGLTKKQLRSKCKQWLDEYTGLHKNSKIKILGQVLYSSEEHMDFREFTDERAKEFLEESDEDYVSEGKYDEKRNLHGWILMEGYDHKKWYQSWKVFGETGIGSYFLPHVKTPVSGETADDRRIELLGDLEKWKTSSDKVFEYKFGKIVEKTITLEDVGKSIKTLEDGNGDYPFHVEKFYPQDNKVGEDPKKFISPSTIIERQKRKAVKKLTDASIV
tara:strand:+ start:348 stop:1550 length:1203 start_codon:yes stop_codon:yes gene_type:complete